MILGRIKLWAVAAGAFLLALLAAWGVGRREGKRAGEQEHLRRRVEAAREAQGVRRDVEGLDDDRVRDRLNDWMREGD